MAGAIWTPSSTSTNISGWSRLPGLSSSKRVFRVRDCGSNWGSASLMRALRRRPRYTMVASAPGFRNSRSFSKMSVHTHTRLMSAMR